MTKAQHKEESVKDNKSTTSKELNIAISNSYHSGVIEANSFILKSLISINGASIISILTFIGNKHYNYNLELLKYSIFFFIIGIIFAVISGMVLSSMFYTLKSKYQNNEKKEQKKISSSNKNNLFKILIVSSLMFFIIGSVMAVDAISLNNNIDKHKKEVVIMNIIRK